MKALLDNQFTGNFHKNHQGRLVLPENPGAYRWHNFQPLPIQISHTVQIYKLPHHHDDPFDRLLVAQGQLESLPLLTLDPEIEKYEVETIW